MNIERGPLVGTLKHGMNCPALTPARADDCDCGLKYRIETQTAETLLAAWQKRAAEAEAVCQNVLSDGLHRCNALEAENAKLQKRVTQLEGAHINWIADAIKAADANRELIASLDAENAKLRAVVDAAQKHVDRFNHCEYENKFFPNTRPLLGETIDALRAALDAAKPKEKP